LDLKIEIISISSSTGLMEAIIVRKVVAYNNIQKCFSLRKEMIIARTVAEKTSWDTIWRSWQGVKNDQIHHNRKRRMFFTKKYWPLLQTKDAFR
jgi:hypothetical protein